MKVCTGTEVCPGQRVSRFVGSDPRIPPGEPKNVGPYRMGKLSVLHRLVAATTWILDKRFTVCVYEGSSTGNYCMPVFQ